jgi:leucyl-tRNA synthetase
MSYNITEIDQWAKAFWNENKVYEVKNDTSLPKHYVLDMFPYPSGAGLHVGHPLGYVASDIYARFKKMQGFNVLHPMGFDSFGLPTEQYAIETGIHPADATSKNITTYKKQINNIGYNYDWSREVITSDPKYYKWTQWIFLRLFDSIYCYENQKAYSISVLINHFETHGNHNNTAFTNKEVSTFSAEDWNQFSEKEKNDILMHYRLAYVDYAEVNWCEALGTVLANDEVINGKSERGGHPVVKKTMKQWFLRISAYAQRLLDNLESLEFTESLKEQQRNWIGKSQGALIDFKCNEETIKVYTTRPDTIFGSTFVVLSPEHPLIEKITSSNFKKEVEAYQNYCKTKSDIDRQAEKKVTGQFTGTYAKNPITQQEIPVYIAEYVLMGYGTGAIMAVPAEDERDFRFAQHFEIPIVEIFDKSKVTNPEIGDKKGIYINSNFLNGLEYAEAHTKIINQLIQLQVGEPKTQFRIRDAGFSRQRYWGEPMPILWKDGIAYPLPEDQLPLMNPEVDEILPTEDGSSPLARNQKWVNEIEGYTRETDTMPAFAGSSWYFLRYMDPNNEQDFVDTDLAKYWNQVDVYVGGTEHAVGHLLYSRFFTNFLYDIQLIPFYEPFKRLINQGMIQGRSNFVYRSVSNPNHFISKNKITDAQQVSPLHVDVNIVENDVLDIDAFKKWRHEFANATFELEEGQYICGWEVEKMSKSKYNVVNPDHIIAKYGSDCFRMYEMFLGPIELSKPWNTAGIEGVSKFLRKFYHLFFNEAGELKITNDAPQAEELKILHKLLKKVTEDIEQFSFNTSVSAFMIAVNELNQIKCDKKAILEPLCRAIAPFAPHLAEHIWSKINPNQSSIVLASFPKFEAQYLIENEIEYPVSINGKMRLKLKFNTDTDPKTIEDEVLANETVQKWMEGKPLKKFIFVKGRMINIVI